MYYILLFFLCFSFTFGFTPVLIKYLKKAHVVDLPGGRHIHESIKPRMGGVLIYLASSFVLIYFSQDLNTSRFLILSSLLIFIIGVLDDVLGISYHIKFIFQLLVSFLLAFNLLRQYGSLQIFGFVVPQPFDSLILIFFITATINSLNFLDGIDGLVSKSSILWFSTILILSTIYSDQFLILLSTSMVGSILGFLHYNSHPARVFLGDTGSLSIGFYLSVSSLLASTKFGPSASIDLTFPMILLAVPLTDACRVIVYRILDGKSPFLPDKTHIHHVLLEKFYSHRTVISIVETLTTIACVLAIAYATGRHLYSLVLFFILLSLIFFIRPVLNYLGNFSSNYSVKRIFNHDWLVITKKIAFFVISALAVFFIISLSSVTTKPDLTITLVLLVLGLVAFGIASVSMKKNKNLYEFFILINILIFILLTNLEKTISAVNSAFSVFSFLFSINDFYILSFLIIILLLSVNISISLHFNEKWTDTITPSLLAIILAAAFFIPPLAGSNTVLILLSCLTIYMWILWIVSYYHNIIKRLLYLSFSLPFGILLKLLVS
jgi:UDP-GlcNAc:undecaprenyl-phosphate GlcNAc-1-phosphate transferase